MLPDLNDFLGILVGNAVALLLLEANEGHLTHLTAKVLTGGHLCRKAHGIGMPPTIGIGPDGAPRVDRPEGGGAGVVEEDDDGGVRRADVGLFGDVVDLEVRLIPGRGEAAAAAAAAAVEEGLGMATVVRYEQIWGGLVVPGVLVGVVVGDVTADAESLGIGPLR